jgi:hypothetical protein
VKESIIDFYKITHESEIIWIINNYKTYWSEQEEKPKNFKTSFLNNPLFRNLKK